MLSKNARKNITFWSIGVFFLLCLGCKQDPVEYNHRMLLVMDGIFEDAKSIDSSLENKDYAKAENKTRIWERKISIARINIRKIGNFRGDSSFRDSNEYVLDIFSDHVIVYYKRLILLLKSEESEESQKIRDTYYKIHLRMDEADKILKSASEKFQMEFDREL